MVIVNGDKTKVLVSEPTIRAIESIKQEHLNVACCVDEWGIFDKLIANYLELDESSQYRVYGVEVWKQVVKVGGAISDVVFDMYEGDSRGEWPFGGDDDVDYMGSYIDGYLDGSMMVNSIYNWDDATTIEDGDESVYVLPDEFNFQSILKG